MVWTWGVGTTAGVDTADVEATLVAGAEDALAALLLALTMGGALGVGCPGSTVLVEPPPLL